MSRYAAAVPLTCPRSLDQSFSESDRRDERQGPFPGLLRFRGGGAVAEGTVGGGSGWTPAASPR